MKFSKKSRKKELRLAFVDAFGKHSHQCRWFSFVMSPVLFRHFKDRRGYFLPFFFEFLASASHALAAALVSSSFMRLPFEDHFFEVNPTEH